MYQDIAQLHEEVLEFLLQERQNNPNLFFSLRSANVPYNQNRLEKGYWFSGGDDTLYFSFWEAFDKITNAYSISISINDRGEMYIYLNARDSEVKAKFFEALVGELGKFTRTQNKKTLTVENVWRRSYRMEEWKISLKEFIDNDIAKINQQLKYYNLGRADNDRIEVVSQSYFERNINEVNRIKTNQIVLRQPEKQYFPLKLQSLTLENIGHFGTLTINLEKRVTCLIGYNGSGKSTILKALALALTGTEPFLNGNKRWIDEKEFGEWLKISNYDNEGKPIYQQKEGLISLTYVTNQIHQNEITLSYDEDFGVVLAQDVVEGFHTVNNNQTEYLFLGFPQGGGHQEPLDLNTENYPEPIDLLPLIKDEAHQKLTRLKNWVDVTHANYLEEKEKGNEIIAQGLWGRIRDVFRLISLVVSDNENENQIQFEKVARDITGKEKTSNIIIKLNLPEQGEQLIALDLVSQGFQNLFYWIGELVSRCYQVNEYYNTNPAHTYKAKDSIFEMEGVILIDEIDTYLHPKWQRNILKVLVDEFSKLQFVVTTHSPLVISNLSTMNIEEEDENGNLLKVKGIDFSIYEITSSDETNQITAIPFAFNQYYPFASKTTRTLKYMHLMERPEIIRLKFNRLDKYINNLFQDKSLVQKIDSLIAELKVIIDPFDEDLLRYETLFKNKKSLITK
jgi:AAA15 family ATPase/GTPase